MTLKFRPTKNFKEISKGKWFHRASNTPMLQQVPSVVFMTVFCQVPHKKNELKY